MDTKIVYGFTPGGLVFIPEKRAEELAGYNDLIHFTGVGETWGLLKLKLPEDVYKTLIMCSEKYDELWDAREGNGEIVMPDD